PDSHMGVDARSVSVGTTEPPVSVTTKRSSRIIDTIKGAHRPLGFDQFLPPCQPGLRGPDPLPTAHPSRQGSIKAAQTYPSFTTGTASFKECMRLPHQEVFETNLPLHKD